MANRKEVETINGYPVLKAGDGRLKKFTVPGTDRVMTLRWDVGPYLIAYASEYHRLVRPIDRGTFDDWSWAPLRSGRASSRPSNHCSGTAVDLNATGEGGQGAAARSWWKANPIKLAQFKRLQKKYRLLEFGYNWKKFWDPMHAEIRTGVTPEMVELELARLGIDRNGVIKK